MSFLDPITAAGPATDLVTTGEPVNVGGSAPPNPGDVLTAVDAENATWQPGGGGGSGGNAGGLETSGDPINVSDAAPPVPGQVLTAVDAEHAVWRVPGLHYDPSIKFWTASAGSATIASGTWGFIEQAVDAVDPIVVYIVSSLEAPPVDARFGLYVGRDVTVPVSVSVLGASQIQGLDGELGPSTALLPGADYEWVFYHEDGAALWGLVSDTASIAKGLWFDGGMVELRTSPPPNPGDVLTAASDPNFAVWMAPSGGGHGLDYASGSSPEIGQWVIAANNTDVVLPMPSEAGQRVGVYMAGADNVNVTSDAYIVLGRNTAPSHPLRPGGWYEWASMDFGEDIRWVPHGGQGDEARPPLEDGGGATSTPAMPNQWILAPNGGVANAPSNPQNGDSFAVYVNGASASVVAAAGHSIVSPDGTTIVASPSALALPGNTYYEWIWIDSTLQWKPKNYLDAPGNGLIRSGKTLAVGANADGSIVVNADDVKVGVLATDAQHGVRGGGTLHAAATSSSNGFMSAQQAEKVNQLSNTFKEPARAVATSNVTLSGIQTIDGVSLVALDRVLLTGQTTPAQNGLWEVSSTAWGRTSDADGILVANEVKSGMLVYVNEGIANADTLWALTTDAPVSLGSTGLTFAQIAGTKGTNNPTDIVSFGTPTAGVSSQWTPRDHRHALVGSHKDAVRAIATSNIILSGTQTVDGVALASLDRCLVAGQTLPANNGIYIVAVGGWSRANDASSNANMSAGTLVPVSEGTTNADTIWTITTDNPITLGATALTFAQIGGLRGGGAGIQPITPIQSAGGGISTKWAGLDHVHAYQLPDPSQNGFRLSSSNISAVTPVEGTSSIIYIIPYTSNKIALWDTTLFVWQIVTNPVVNSATLAGHTAGTPVDVFARYIGSGNSLAIDLVNWTNATTRATSLTTRDGVTVGAGGNSARYLGTILPDTATSYLHTLTASGPFFPICGIWNQDNRLQYTYTWSAAFDSWIATTTAWQNLNLTTTGRIRLLQGIVGDYVEAVHYSAVDAQGASAGPGIGLNTSTSPASGFRDMSNDTGKVVPVKALMNQPLPAIGVHNLQAIVNTNTAVSVFYGNHGTFQGGIMAKHWC